MTHREFMREAARLAIQNAGTADGGPFGAIVVAEGSIIARGVNTVTRDHDPTAHAEVSAIREAGRVLGTFDLAGCEIYTSCEPCPMCLGAIYWAQIGKIYYGATADDAAAAGFADAFIYRELSRPRDQRELRLIELERDICLQAFQVWEANTGRISY